MMDDIVHYCLFTAILVCTVFMLGLIAYVLGLCVLAAYLELKKIFKNEVKKRKDQ